MRVVSNGSESTCTRPYVALQLNLNPCVLLVTRPDDSPRAGTDDLYMLPFVSSTPPAANLRILALHSEKLVLRGCQTEWVPATTSEAGHVNNCDGRNEESEEAQSLHPVDIYSLLS